MYCEVCETDDRSGPRGVADEPPLGTSMTRRIRERERQYEMYAAGSSQREIIKSFEKETPEVLPRAFRSTMRFKLSSFVEVRHMIF